MPNIQGYLIAILVSGLLSASGGFYVAHEIGKGELAAYANSVTNQAIKASEYARQRQKEMDQVAIEAATNLGREIVTIDVANAVIIKEVTTHVKVTSIPCVPYGFVRVLDAEVFSRDPDDLVLPANVTDDTCAPLAAPDLAKSIAANFGNARENAAQLDALIATWGRLNAAQSSSGR